MKLDPRIIEGKRPFGRFYAEEAKQFIGKKCYFADNVFCFRDLNGKNWGDLTVATLTNVDTDTDFNAYGIDENTYFAFCLPCEWVQEKKEPEYQAFDYDSAKRWLKEWVFADTDFAEIRHKATGNTFFVRNISVSNASEVHFLFGACWIRSETMAKFYEIRDPYTGEWVPFGVEE